MFVNFLPLSLNRQSAVFTTFTFVGILLLTVLGAQPAACKPALNTEMPQILQAVSEQLPDEWHPSWMSSGEVKMLNPVQRLNARIDHNGVRLTAANGLRFSMQLTHYGFNSRLQTPQSNRVRINGVRVEVRHDPDLSEWFINTPLGIEQGFYLQRGYHQPEAADDSRTQSNFELHFKIGGDLIPAQTADGLDFMDASGQVQMHYNQLLAFDANHQILPARFQLSGNLLRISVETAGARFPVTIDPIFSSEQSLSASDAAAEDQFGDAVAIDADTIVVGAPLVNSGTATDTGAVYVFVRDPSTGVFTEQQKLTAADAAAEDNFGSAVDIDGYTIVVGAPQVNSGLTVDTGAVYVFTRDPTIANNPWTQQQKLTAADATANDLLGTSVYVEGHTLVAGAPRKNSGTANATGAVYVFTRDPDDQAVPWTQQQKLTATDAAAEDQFGTSVSLNGNTIIVGTPLDNLGTAFDAGSVYVFIRDQTAFLNPWTQRQRLTASNARAGDRLGASVSIDANTILAGAPRADFAGSDDSGAAYVFTRESASADFSQVQILRARIASSDSQFGTSVFVDGPTALIGAPGTRSFTATDAGAAYFFAREALSGDWRQQQELTGSSPEALAEFGEAVGLDAATAIIGSAKRNQGTATFAGTAFVFVLEPEDDEISQETDILTAANAAANDAFGSAVGLSGDNTLIGIPDADPGGDLNAGEVSAFERNANTQVFDDEVTLTSGDKSPFDAFGAAVSLDADIAVIAAPDDNVDGDDNAGSAYVFNRNLDTGDWDQAVKLTAGADVTAFDNFGAAVAIDDDIILIGVPADDPNGIPNAGSAFLFSRDPDEAAPDQWSRTDKLTAGAAKNMNDNFGAAVALNSDTALVGAPFEDDGGAVFVFVRDPGDNSWTRQQKLTASDARPGDEFGNSVSVFGNTAIIGAPQADVTGVTTAGAVYIFTRDPTRAANPWTELQKLELVDAATGDAFGTAVTLVGNMAVVGAPGVDLPPDGMVMRVNAGAAYDFRRDPDTNLFSLRTELTASDAMADEAFGTAAIVACDTIIIGAPDVDLSAILLNAGAVFVFQIFPVRDDSNGSRGSSSSLNCFIDSASAGLPLNTLGGVLMAVTTVIIFLLGVPNWVVRTRFHRRCFQRLGRFAPTVFSRLWR
ncbi:MAG: hypothetical protein PVF38_01695 [Desulfobacterales bacterium]|jgi:hypothetical protein